MSVDEIASRVSLHIDLIGPNNRTIGNLTITDKISNGCVLIDGNRLIGSVPTASGELGISDRLNKLVNHRHNLNVVDKLVRRRQVSLSVTICVKIRLINETINLIGPSDKIGVLVVRKLVIMIVIAKHLGRLIHDITEGSNDIRSVNSHLVLSERNSLFLNLGFDTALVSHNDVINEHTVKLADARTLNEHLGTNKIGRDRHGTPARYVLGESLLNSFGIVELKRIIGGSFRLELKKVFSLKRALSPTHSRTDGTSGETLIERCERRNKGFEHLFADHPTESSSNTVVTNEILYRLIPKVRIRRDFTRLVKHIIHVSHIIILHYS